VAAAVDLPQCRRTRQTEGYARLIQRNPGWVGLTHISHIRRCAPRLAGFSKHRPVGLNRMSHPSAHTEATSLATERPMPVRPRAATPLRHGSTQAQGKAPDQRAWSALLGLPAPSASECHLLDGLAKPRLVAQGQTVFSRGQPARALVALLDGEVALGFRTADGTFRTERLVRGPAWLDLGSAWLADGHAMDAQAWNLATVLELPRETLQPQIERNPGLARRMIQGLAREVQALTVNTHELMHKDAPARLAQWLHQRCEPLNGNHGVAVVQLSDRKRDIASQLAITPETLSRLMRSFTRQGVIEVAGYTVRVLDVAALGRLAQA
jgi:CRP-like cAMP-binding protein